MKNYRALFLPAMPAVFVLLWSTGFIGAKLGLPYAEPFTFLSLRMLGVLSLLLSVALITRARWPQTPALWFHLAVSGFLVHGLYLGGVFAAIKAGLASGVTALVVGLQPVLTALIAQPLLGERVSPRQWGGLVLGLVGVTMVLSGRLTGFSGFSWGGIAFALVALAGITAGTLYQKRFCTGMDLKTGTFAQYVGASFLLMPAAWLTEGMQVQWTGTFVFALGWLVLVLSMGAIFLLMTLIRLGEASRVASLFYLTPPVTAVMAWALFDEQLGPVGLVGMAIAAAGVALVVARR